MNYFKISLIFMLSVLAASFIFPIGGNNISGNGRDGQNFINIKIGEVNLLAEIAGTPNERSAGLSGRDYLGGDHGMLFVFETPGNYSFWMKEMKFPIDIIWIDENLIVAEIMENISPDTYPESFKSAEKIKYVLETNSGFSRKNKITAGQKLIFAENQIK